jgi:hypothetical protein
MLAIHLFNDHDSISVQRTFIHLGQPGTPRSGWNVVPGCTSQPYRDWWSFSTVYPSRSECRAYICWLLGQLDDHQVGR